MSERLKKVLEKIRNVLAVVGGLAVVAIGFLAGLFFGRRNTKQDAKAADTIAEVSAENAALRKEKEIEEKDAAELVAESSDPASHTERITAEQDDFRERVRDRLNENIHGR